ncbi:MAG: 2-polyprenyl-6-methoxyphenol hydroxylase [Betaproteobacteria bacterium]|nr:2-polyprenyl-6-methoxyphenol hydroxylase [Betaproteobacteria bacterium]
MTFDAVIIGGGPIGIATGLALSSLGYRILIAEKREAATPRDDRRILALSQGSRLILERLGVWQALSNTTSITQIRVSDRGALAPVTLRASECRVPALGHVTTFNDLSQALSHKLQEHTNAEIRFGCTARTASMSAHTAEVELEAGKSEIVSAPLVIHAEGGGRPSDGVSVKDYAQWAIVAEVWSQQPHLNRAHERFCETGPIALLPFEDHFALIWTVSAERGDALMNARDSEFTQALSESFGPWARRFTRVSPRARFPLRLVVEPRTSQGRALRVGNAAQQIHPVAAQGFNLGLRDIWALRELLWKRPADPGDPAILREFASNRHRDRSQSVRLTDALVGIFGSSHPAVRAGRTLALSSLARFKPLRTAFARHMMFGL